MKKFLIQLKNLWNWVKNIFGVGLHKIKRLITVHPGKSFFGTLAVMLFFIIVGNIYRNKPATSTQSHKLSIPVSIFSIGTVPKMRLPASVEKSGSLQVTAASAGFIQKINVSVGDVVSRGRQLFWISTNSQGGTIPTINRQLAEKQDTLTHENFDKQMELIKKRRELADQVDSMSDEMRNISEKSIDETNDLINLNQEILDQINSQLQTLESTNVGGANDQLILQAKQGKAAVMAGINGLRAQVRSIEFQSDSEKAPAKISNLTRESTMLQLDVEEKSVKLALEVSALNLKIAQIAESLAYPVAPCNGTINRILVKKGQTVGPGTSLLTIACKNNHATVVVSVTKEIAGNVSRIEKSLIKMGSQTIELTPTHISTEPTEGKFFSIQYVIDDEKAHLFGDGSSVVVEVPVGGYESTATVPFIPIDAVYQSQSGAYLYLVGAEKDKSIAKVRSINLGRVFGDYVEVVSGLGFGDQIIIDRLVIDGDPIEIVR